MPWHSSLTQLRNALAELYSSVEDISRVAASALLPRNQMSLQGKPLNDWQSVLEEAAKQGMVDAIITAAAKEYPTNLALLEAIHSYRQWVTAARQSTSLSGGDIYFGGSFVPMPQIPANNSNLPQRHPNFIGRSDEIRKVLDALASRAWIIAIDGMGGVGKTTLALEVAYLCKDQSMAYMGAPKFGGYIWVSARDKLDFGLEDVIQEILTVLGTFQARSGSLDRNERLELAIRALAAEPCLLIIDNFETVKDEALCMFLRDQLPNPSKVMITSRHHIQTGERVITIGGLEEKAAVELLEYEAERLDIPIGQQDAARLHYVAQKTYGIPLVLRWTMEMVYGGKSLEWVLESLEKATARDIFSHIFERSLSVVDQEAQSLFRSLSALVTWARLDTIAAMNPRVTSIQERLGRLVSLSLVEDNRSLVVNNRRFQLPALARYMARQQLAENSRELDDCIQCGIRQYITEVRALVPYSESALDYLRLEFPNIGGMVNLAAESSQPYLLELCIELAESMNELDSGKGGSLLAALTSPVERVGDDTLVLQLLSAIGNPYIAGPPVHPPMFFGRQDLVRFIQECFEGDGVKAPVVSLVGERRIGKTSLLQFLRNLSTNTCVYAYVDFLMMPAITATEHLLFSIAYQASRSILLDRLGPDAKLASPRRDDFEEQPYEAFRWWIQNSLQQLRTKRLVLMLDEIENLFHSPISSQVDQGSLLSYFRGLAQGGELGFITAGVTPLHRLPQSGPVSPFFNIAAPRRVSLLTRQESEDLIRRPMYGLLSYEPAAIDYLLNQVGGHPYLLQSMCSEIVDLCRETRKLTVDTETVELAIRTMFGRSQYYWHDLWERFGDVERVVVTSSVALTRDNDSFTSTELENLGLGLTHLEIERALDELIDRDIMERDSQGGYRFAIRAFGRWVLKEKM